MEVFLNQAQHGEILIGFIDFFNNKGTNLQAT